MIEESKPKYTCSECGKNYATSSNLSRYREGDFTSAIQHYSMALRYNPRDTRVLSNRAACYLKLLLWDLCIQVMES